MRKIQLTICFLLFSLFMEGQNGTGYTKTRNYTAEKTYLDASTQAGSSARTINDIVYPDGFGRKRLEIQVKAGPSGTGDLVIPHEYNIAGKAEKEYLPYAKEGNNGAFDPEMFLPSRWNTYGADEQAYAFTRIQYENNPQGRVVKQTGPGKAWHTGEKATNTVYGLNQNAEVRLYKVASNGPLSLSGTYLTGTLEKATMTDEDGHKTEVFTDNSDKTVLTVAFDGNTRIETYYVYDDRSQLRYVLPPEASQQLQTATVDNSILEKLVYYYEYDKLGRMIVKRLPGCKPVYQVFDRHDRLVLSQDGRQRTSNVGKWNYFVYDSQNRIVENGEIILSSSLTHQQLQQAAWQQETYFPAGTRTPLQYAVYDNYKSTGNVTTQSFSAITGYANNFNPHVSGLATSIKVRLLGTNDWITTTTYYDDRCRPLQIVCQHPQCGLSYITTDYDFVGNVLKQHQQFGTDKLETGYSYDDRSRLLSKTNTWNGKVTDALSYTYDAVGRMKTKQYGSRASEALSYNIRSWLTKIESPYFSQTLHYADGTGTPCFNGNISSMLWKAGSETTQRGYKFSYDGLSRLKNAIYGEGGDFTLNANRFNEQVLNYDKQGNILGLLRYGQTSASGYGLIDNLNLTYTGNQLKSVRDNATNPVYGSGFEFKDGANVDTEYVYDENGNLIKDLNKKITSIQYNCLDLPEKVQFEGGNNISNLYAADGTKFRTTHTTGGTSSTTDYCGNAIYENGVLVKVLTEDGYITAGDSKFHYFIQDHQGNNRVVVDQSGKIEEVNHYYPFGGLLASSGNVQPYKYNGKELDRSNGLDWYDYGARQYDAAIGRWHVVDPKSEDYYSENPYGYCGNNPINCIDPDGQKIIFINGYLGFGSPEGGAVYWGGANGSFVKNAQSFFGDNKTYFTNIEFEYFKSTTSLRTFNGYNYAKTNYEQLISDMDPKKDVFRVISHSMGGAFSEGMMKYLKEQGWTVDMAIYLNAWLPSELKGSHGTFVVDATITNDWVQALSLPVTFSRDILSADYKIRKRSEEKWDLIHRELIDLNSLWNKDALNWKQLTPLIQSWLKVNPNIKIYYGQ